MNKSIPTYLRLLSDSAESPARPDEDLARWLALCEAFHDCTGWRLEFARGGAPKHDAHSMWSAPVEPGVGNSLGHIRIVSRDGDDPAARSSLAQAKLMAAACGGLWGEVLGAREALRRREAELAAGVPVSMRPDEEGHLADRLEAVLGAGADATRCQAAALYLLDEGTSELKLRASWGMPRRTLLEPARPLRGAAADLEALLGHAVVVNDPRLFEYWKVPRPCAAAACVPVSSPTNPLGTLWVFANDPRDFSSVETNLLEVVAGRLAADLEREMLFAELERMRLARSENARAERRLPALPQRVSLDHWEVGGWRSPQSGHSHAWVDWFAVASDHMAFTAGRCDGPSALATEAATRAAARAASNWDVGPSEAIRRVNAALWALDEGAAGAGLAYAKLDTHHGLLTVSLAGDVGLAFVAAPGSKASPCVGSRRPAEASAGGAADSPAQVLQAEPGGLGSDESAVAAEHTLRFKPGDALIAWSGPATDATSGATTRATSGATSGATTNATSGATARATSGATTLATSDVGKIAAAAFHARPDLSVTDRAALVGEKLAALAPGSWATLVLRRR